MCQVDGEICTIELPNGLVKQWENKPEFQAFYEEFLVKYPLAATFQSKGKVETSAGTVVVTPVKRPAPFDLSSCLNDVGSLPDEDVIKCEVPVVNGRAGVKLTTMPTLVVAEKTGPYLKNETGHEVPGLDTCSGTRFTCFQRSTYCIMYDLTPHQT